jgi:hypothetical protein
LRASEASKVAPERGVDLDDMMFPLWMTTPTFDSLRGLRRRSMRRMDRSVELGEDSNRRANTIVA